MSSKFTGLENIDHPLWCPESVLNGPARRSSSFVIVQPIALGSAYDDYNYYYAWCKENLQSHVLCYYSDSENLEEAWGFGGPESDITMWMLKWVK